MRLTEEHNVLPQKMISEFENSVKERNRICGNDIVMGCGYDTNCDFPDKVLTYVFYAGDSCFDRIKYTFSVAFTSSTASDELMDVINDYEKYNNMGVLHYDSYSETCYKIKKKAFDYLMVIHYDSCKHVCMDNFLAVIVEKYSAFIKVRL